MVPSSELFDFRPRLVLGMFECPRLEEQHLDFTLDSTECAALVSTGFEKHQKSSLNGLDLLG